MPLRDWIFLVASVGHLALALISLARIGKAPLALPLALLAFDFFGWSFATLGNHLLSESANWRTVDVVFSALTPPIVLHVVLVFVGRLRARAFYLRLAYVTFGALALASFSRSFAESNTWNVVFLTAWAPTLIAEIILLVRHLRDASDHEEKMRTRLMLAALLIGASFASTDLWADLGAPIPRLTPLGTLLSTAILAVVALELRLFGRALARTSAVYAVAIAASAVLLYLTLFKGLGGNLPALTFGVTLVTFFLGAVVREAVSSAATQRERVERLAVLGRFSAQMAHDLKNPLAALVGAVQVLEGDPSGSKDLRTLVVDQANRIRTIVEKYDRMGRVEPVRSLVRVNDLVRRVVASAKHGTSRRIALGVDLDETIPECDVDPDLVSGALENLVRNALEASREGGSVVVRTRHEIGGGGALVRLAVEDDGEGMDARTAERAFDDFFTTKAEGSGLGLAFARRVALAHGGDASLTSRRGVGTTVSMRIPTGPSE